MVNAGTKTDPLLEGFEKLGLVSLLIFIAATSIAADKTTTAATRVTYGTYENPFESDSIWNTPIASGAEFRALALDIADFPAFYPENIIYHIGNGTSHGVKTKSPGDHPFYSSWDYGDDGAIYGGIVTTWKLPSGLFIKKRVSNGIIVYYDESTKNFQEGSLFENCGNGPAVAWQPTVWFSPNSDGLHSGEQLGSRITAVGGTIRNGELLGSEPIPHMLKIAMDNYTFEDYQWPATASDGNGKKGSFPCGQWLKTGAILAIPPWISEVSLSFETEPGKKIFNALRTYGGIIVDTGSSHHKPANTWRSWMLGMEHDIYHNNLVEEDLDSLGISSSGDTRYYDKNVPFKRDLNKIFENLHAIANNDQINPKGPSGTTSTSTTATTGRPSQPR